MKKKTILKLHQLIKTFNIIIINVIVLFEEQKNTEIKNPKAVKAKHGRIILLSKCALRDSKKSRFINKQEATGLLSSLGIRKPLREIPLVGPLLFQGYQQVNIRYKINEIVNQFLSTGDKSMPKMNLRQPRFTCSACGPFTKNKERLQKFKETGDS